LEGIFFEIFSSDVNNAEILLPQRTTEE